MTLDEAKVLWQAQQAAGPSPLSNEAVMAFVQTRSAAFDALIRRRDRRENAAVIGVALLFGLAGILFTVGQFYLASLGSVCIVLASAWIYRKLNRTRIRHDTDAGDAPLGQTLRRELDKVNAQIDLLRTVFWWYILPLMTGMLLFALGLPGDPPLRTIALIVIVSVVVYWINKQAVKTELLPLRREFTELLSDLLDHKE